ncbi:MAG: HAMP domain-containing protein [Deltaproteobacteria bacterium]|nr:HAMP domain-containing protein [Deltaproteobacteria bacterium]
MFGFAYPVKDEAGTLRAVLFAGIDLGWLRGFVARANPPGGVTVTLLDRDGRILDRYPALGAWLGRLAPRAFADGSAAERNGGRAARDLDGTRSLLASAVVDDLPAGMAFRIVLAVPEANLYARANRELIRDLLWLGLAGLGILGFSWWAGGRLIVRPVRNLADAVESVARGDLGARSQAPRGTGELTDLSAAFDRMAGALEARRTQAEHAEDPDRERGAVSPPLRAQPRRNPSQEGGRQDLPRVLCSASARRSCWDSSGARSRTPAIPASPRPWRNMAATAVSWARSPCGGRTAPEFPLTSRPTSTGRRAASTAPASSFGTSRSRSARRRSCGRTRSATARSSTPPRSPCGKRTSPASGRTWTGCVPRGLPTSVPTWKTIRWRSGPASEP